ncbi:RNA polymerase sigma-70 factor [Flavivirga amylovorans]|uniref:RNA polymerase sigma-70 factor n=1 Tax=Flavivirga amylovorans TaxID=870486 RepID=A0ABT8X0Z9_9FLAO|nr:RNA polymerase sigma-70 factor [Flavivirga amylovorans]MDO5987616.1 RNA polymerase sigma-70 factor [Flavivirga amylovorans]
MKRKQKNNYSIKEAFEAGNREAFKLLFEAYYDKLFVYINGFTNDSFLTQDIIQDTFVKLWNRRDSLKLEQSVTGYLYKTAYNTFCNNYRDQRKESKMLDSLTYEKITNLLSEDTDERLAKIERIKAVIEKLPPKTLRVFKMSKYQGYKYHEIAKELNISIKTVENQMTRAFAFIRKEMKDKDTFSLFVSLYF